MVKVLRHIIGLSWDFTTSYLLFMQSEFSTMHIIILWLGRCIKPGFYFRGHIEDVHVKIHKHIIIIIIFIPQPCSLILVWWVSQITREHCGAEIHGFDWPTRFWNHTIPTMHFFVCFSLGILWTKIIIFIPWKVTQPRIKPRSLKCELQYMCYHHPIRCNKEWIVLGNIKIKMCLHS